MPTPKRQFFHYTGATTLGALAELCGGELEDPSTADWQIEDVAPLYRADENHISFLDNPRYADQLEETQAGACILKEEYLDRLPDGTAALIHENPYYAYSLVSGAFYVAPEPVERIHPTAQIDPTAVVGEGTMVGAYAVIGANVVVGANCQIASNVAITHAEIGDNVIIHPGVRIGQDGFGFATHEGRHHKIPQLGGVVIGDDVEIGANCTIDRGSGPDTVIGEGTKIDNLVQIAHNVQLGRHCIIVAQVGIAGSTRIGDYVVLGGQVGVAGHLNIGDQVRVAAQSGIMRDVPGGLSVGGSPSVPIKQYHRQTTALQKLVKQQMNFNTPYDVENEDE